MKNMISVIIPVYNAQEAVVRALQSVLAQTYTGYEIILINDGSTDNSLQVLEKWKLHNSDKQVVIINQPNGGVSKARNEGIKAAKGKYVAFLDSDDEWLFNKLEKQMAVLRQHPAIDFIGCSRNNERVKIGWKRFDKLSRVGVKDLLLKMFPQTSTAIVKKEALLDVGLYDEKQRYAEDGNLWLRICGAKQFYFMPESLVITGSGKPNFGYSGLSANTGEMHKGEIKNLKEARCLKYISRWEYALFFAYTKVKYLRRLLIIHFLR